MFNPFGAARYKDLPNLTPMFGNIGKSWNNPLPNDLYIKGVPKNIFKETNFTGNVGTGLDTLRTFTFPAGSFRLDQQDYFQARVGGGFLANDDNKRVQLSFGGNILLNTGSLDVDNFGYYWDLVIMRLTNTTFNYILGCNLGQIVADSAAVVTSVGSLHTARTGNIVTLSGGTTFDGNAQVLLLEAESSTATNNNIINNIWVGELTRF